MYQRERIDRILSILKANGYVTVKYLTNILHYSTATINRDLNIMENQKLIIRTYGGAELCQDAPVPLEFRYDKAKPEKRKIAKCAADLICDGDTVFIDGSTTCEGIGDFIINKKDITVITNNLALVTHLSEYGINAVCTGGSVVEPPYMLAGEDAVRTIMRYNTDKMFFSTSAATDDGIISCGILYNALHDAALKNTDKAYFLIDRSKINLKRAYNIADFSEVFAVISDYRFPEQTRKNFPKTKFFTV